MVVNSVEVTCLNKLPEPNISKNVSQPNDHKELTFKDFIVIQQAAQQVANNIGYPVYLVGSALHKHLPRDIDLSIIIPHDEYVEKYSIDLEQKFAEYHCMTTAFHKSFDDIGPLVALGHFGTYYIDLKICPSNWWTSKDKMILAEPLKGLK